MSPTTTPTNHGATAPDQLVYIVDDDEALRDSLLWLLDSTGIKAQAFSSAESFLSAWSSRMSGCLVLDIRMPGMTGLELQEKLHAMHSTLPIIFITGHGDVPMAVSALKSGAVDFIEKPFNDQDMVKLIHAALSEDRKHHDSRLQEADAQRRIDGLTPREKEVLELIVAGRLNKQIADDLGISIKTVEVHRARVMEKMGVNSLAELVQHVMSAHKND
ncbi:MAG: response regulator transcription factor [Candidatus Dactylopiibacterium sp.]|nr:response regulator transcription factor [Candidatus Dactylopiibacterium sp.]